MRFALVYFVSLVDFGIVVIHHIHVYRLHAFRIHNGQAASDERAPVAALDDVLVVTQLAHDLVHRFCVVDMLESLLIRIRREPVAR